MSQLDIYRKLKDIDQKKYFLARYILRSSKSVWDAAYDLAVGQSIGNPNVRNDWETDELINNYSALIVDEGANLKKEKTAIVTVAFPVANIDWATDGISQLLCTVMGGQMDIDHITQCQLFELIFPDTVKAHFLKPTYGLSGMRKFTGVYNKPLLGGIIKPKTGLRPDQLLDMTKQLVNGGVDFIKEDEIMGNPAVCPFDKRVELISDYINNCGRKVIYCFCINSDPLEVFDRVADIMVSRGNGLHVNVWSGLGIYNSVRKYGEGWNLGKAPFIHFQKSGDKVFTDSEHRFHIAWPVIAQLAALSGVDSIHAGMYGGYLTGSEAYLGSLMEMLKEYNVIPALSCGMHPGLVDNIRGIFGNDWMANVGGAIHGHPGGSNEGAIAMKQAIEGCYDGSEYKVAIEKWGKV